MFSVNSKIALLVNTFSTGDSAFLPFTPDIVSMFIDYVRPLVACELGDFGLALAVCHELALTAKGSNGSAGPLTEEREGQLQRAYAAPTGIPAYWASSGYGLRFYGLVQRLIVPIYNRQIGYGDGVRSVLPPFLDADNNFDGEFPGVGGF